VNAAGETLAPFMREFQQVRRRKSSRDVGQTLNPVVASGNTTSVPEFIQRAAQLTAKCQQQHGLNA